MRRLCHISTTFNLKSGSARRTSAILRKCVSQQYEVLLIVGRDHDVTEEDLPGVAIYHVPQLVKYVNPWLDILALVRIAKLLKTDRPEVVHTHLAKAGIIGRFAAKWAQVPQILHTVHGPTFPASLNRLKRDIYRWLEKISGQMTDEFIFVGEELRDSYIEAGICPPEKAHVVRTGRPDTVVDRKRLDPSARSLLRQSLHCPSEEDFLIVTVGRIVPAKQLDHAICILEKVRESGVNFRLAIVGKSLLDEEKGYEMQIRQQVKELGLDDVVYFAGFRHDVLDIMDAADAVLLTSRYEGLPNVAVEALIAQTPMVAYDVSGIREVLQRISSHYIVNQGDIKGAAQALSDVNHLRQSNTVVNDADANERQEILDSFREGFMLHQKMMLYDRVFTYNNE